MTEDDGQQRTTDDRGRQMAEDDGRQRMTDDRERRTTEDDGRHRTTDDRGRRMRGDDGWQRTTDDREGRRMADDGRQHPSYAGCNTGDSGTWREREWCCWFKCTRRCIKKEGGSGEKASIYMILALTLVPCATPTRHTPVDHRYTIPYQARAPTRLMHIIMPRSLRGARACVGTAGGTHPPPATH